MLLEREAERGPLQNLLREASKSRGHTVVISGEARIGKTALTRTFLKNAAPLSTRAERCVRRPLNRRTARPAKGSCP
ncbi:ATP-binding protein [Octadecabacter antarcticus]|uniref:ATP-binding protein n=1 Tax=Octadecabacter antarcticus TaxID=1217908 RepID=UPI000A03A1C2